MKEFLQRLHIITADEPVSKDTSSQVDTPVVKITASTEPRINALDIASLEGIISSKINAAPSLLKFNEFLQKHDALLTIIPDEATRVKAAIASSGINVTELISSAQAHLPALDAESELFNASYVTASEDEILSIISEIDETNLAIAKLTEQLGELSTKKTNLESALNEKNSTLAHAKIDFQLVTSKLSAFYTDFIVKINKYTGAV